MLIAEDEFLIAMDLESQVENAGHIVIGIAATQDKVIAIAMRERPDLVLMDLQLAGPSSGIEAARHVRAEYGIASILLSGSLHQLTDRDIADIMPVAMLSKPVLPSEVERELDQVQASGSSANALS